MFVPVKYLALVCTCIWPQGDVPSPGSVGTSDRCLFGCRLPAWHGSFACVPRLHLLRSAGLMPPSLRGQPLERYSAVEHLLRRRGELQSEVRQLSTKIARAKISQRVLVQRSLPLTLETISAAHRRLILCAFWLTSFVTQDCLVLLEQVRVPPPWGSLDSAGRTALVDDLFLAADLDEVETWVDPACPENHNFLRELWILYAEWRTAKWVHHTNSVHGVAPSSAQLFAVYIEWRRKGPAELHPRTFARTLGARRKWAMRWRRRWNGSVGHLKTGDLDPRDVLRQKVLRWRAPGVPY